ncbi:DUF6675 family protein [uncultured Treponema sp.]|uniref:DUF6675 family protein n=1 Tax=uncultured Treponema sp. TaxID=162155 RepID=UPI0025FAF6BE|nr:DUF6675 family protein [uncultured Treponema sp.]
MSFFRQCLKVAFSCRHILPVLLLFFSLPDFAQTPVKIMDGEIDYLFNERMSGREILFLRNGGIVCNSIGKVKYARINKIPEAERLINAVQKVDPNHLAEIIKILPYKGFENLTEIVSEMLKNEESYTSVPLYVDDGEVVHLYADARIQSIKTEPTGKEIITEKFLMKPLDYYTAKIEFQQFGSYYFYQMKNINTVRYKTFISAVGKEKMIAVISIFRYGDNWIIYALGGVDIIRIPFLDKKIDNIFYNRIKAFCVFTFEKLEELLSKDEEN